MLLNVSDSSADLVKGNPRVVMCVYWLLSYSCLLQDTVMWRARFPWKPDCGLPKGPDFIHSFFGGQMHGLVYGLPGDVVRTSLSPMTNFHLSHMGS